jgi:glycerol-3-phosphate dehydrogenase
MRALKQVIVNDDAHLISAYKGLEPKIWDLVCMAEIVSLIENEGSETGALSGQVNARHVSIKMKSNTLAFAQGLLRDMIDDLASHWERGAAR